MKQLNVDHFCNDVILAPRKHKTHNQYALVWCESTSEPNSRYCACFIQLL